VTLSRKKHLVVQIRFTGGANKTLNLPLPKKSWELKQTDQRVVQEIDHLLNHYTISEIAQKLNEQGFCSGWGKRFHPTMVARLCSSYQLKSRYDRLREQGLLTAEELAATLNIKPPTVKTWRTRKLLRCQRYNDKGGFLYEQPGADTPVKHKWKRNQNNMLEK